MNDLVYGKIKIKDSKYEMVEKAAAILEENGFVFQHIKTDGETDYDMGIHAHNETYKSFDEYYKVAPDKYVDTARGNMYTISWEFTHFVYKNEEENLEAMMTVLMGTPSDGSPPAVTYCFFSIDKKRDYNTDFAEKTKAKLEVLNSQASN